LRRRWQFTNSTNRARPHAAPTPVAAPQIGIARGCFVGSWAISWQQQTVYCGSTNRTDVIAASQHYVAPSFPGLSFSVDPSCPYGVWGEWEVAHEVCDFDVVGVVAVLCEFAQAGEVSREVVPGVKDRVV
jgi:hypothetical protein